VSSARAPVVAAGAIVGAHYLGRTAAFVLGEEIDVLADRAAKRGDRGMAAPSSRRRVTARASSAAVTTAR